MQPSAPPFVLTGIVNRKLTLIYSPLRYRPNALGGDTAYSDTVNNGQSMLPPPSKDKDILITQRRFDGVSEPRAEGGDRLQFNGVYGFNRDY